MDENSSASSDTMNLALEKPTVEVKKTGAKKSEQSKSSKQDLRKRSRAKDQDEPRNHAPVFSGMMRSISLAEPTPGTGRISLAVRSKNGHDRRHELRHGEWIDVAGRFIAAHAGKRKIRMTTTDDAARNLEIEIRG